MSTLRQWGYKYSDSTVHSRLIQPLLNVSDAEEVPPQIQQAGGALLTSDQFTSPGPGSGSGGTQNGPPGTSGPRRSKRLNYGASRRYSTTTGHALPSGAFPGGGGAGLNLQLPQLDGIQRTQKILDMRLQNLQAQSDQLNCASGNARIKEEIMHVRQLIGENQKALSSIVKAASQMQEQIAMLNNNMEQWILAQASGREIRTLFVEERSASSKSRRKERRERERDRERESLVREV
ncbi:Short transient receptor potential channel 6 [Fasciola gigantica]|uniref:Short transient receptor potential channel 6 n=1 Tax=Fasciola gigantica TaxID=46835 RepID=A0A504YEB2_FASGI|nr:Short transient receptor potential channel 6 [Fasciola gigantica]